MLNEDIPAISNRTELIKKARESCSRGLVDSNSNQPKSNYIRHSSGKEATKVGDVSLKLKFLLIRMVIALVLITGVVIIDQLNLSYQDYSSQQIRDQIQSNHLYEEAKDFVDSFTKEDVKEIMNQEE